MTKIEAIIKRNYDDCKAGRRMFRLETNLPDECTDEPTWHDHIEYVMYLPDVEPVQACDEHYEFYFVKSFPCKDGSWNDADDYICIRYHAYTVDFIWHGE